MNPKWSPAMSSNTSANKKEEVSKVMERYKKEQLEAYIKELENEREVSYIWSNNALKKLNSRF
jgi:hypothetical protein